jgi:hypothetical protein
MKRENTTVFVMRAKRKHMHAKHLETVGVGDALV